MYLYLGQVGSGWTYISNRVIVLLSMWFKGSGEQKQTICGFSRPRTVYAPHSIEQRKSQGQPGFQDGSRLCFLA